MNSKDCFNAVTWGPQRASLQQSTEDALFLHCKQAFGLQNLLQQRPQVLLCGHLAQHGLKNRKEAATKAKLESLNSTRDVKYCIPPTAQ